jgi:AraC family transcriptional regulator, transcriptional activator of pobA
MEGSTIFSYNSAMPATQETSAIQVFNLFGESGDLPDVVHCETIATRSVLHDWKFAAHRHARLHQVLLIETGGGEATLEGRVHELRPMYVVNVPAGQVHGYSFEPGTLGWVLTIAAEILDETLLSSEGLRGVLSQSAVVRGTPQIRAVMKQIFAEYAGRDFGRAHVLRALSAAQIGLAARQLVNRRPKGGATDSNLFRRFERLLERHHLERSVGRIRLRHRIVGDANTSQPGDARGDRGYSLPPHPQSDDPRGAAKSRLYQYADLNDFLCAWL